MGEWTGGRWIGSGKIAISEKLAERHRVALEGWITRTQCTQQKAPEGDASDSEEAFVPLALEPPELDFFLKSKVKRSSPKGPRSSAPSKGIITRGGRARLYQVLVVINNIELFAAGTSELAKAVDVHMALTSLKQRVLKTPSLWERFAEELECATGTI